MKEKISLLKRVSIVDDARSILRDMVIPPELLKEKTNGGRITSVCEKSKEGGTAYLEVMGGDRTTGSFGSLYRMEDPASHPVEFKKCSDRRRSQ